LFIIARRLLGTSAALVTAGFFATFPTAVHYAREIRMYPLLTVLFLLSFLCFLNFYQNKPGEKAATIRRPQLVWLISFSIFLALSFYTHYTAAILFMLYTLAGLYSLICGDRTAFFWTFLGLFIATVLVLPQLNHLFSSSLGDPDKFWMQATTWPIFYSMSMGAYPYAALFKPVVFLVMAVGFVLLWLQNRTLAGIILLFTAGGMVLAALIGVFEPIYLVRTIQIYTVFTAILVAVTLLKLPCAIAISLGLGLVALNIYTVIKNEYLHERVALFADQTGGFVALLDPNRDQAFAKNYLQPQMDLMRVPLFETAQVISHTKQADGISDIETEVARCLGTNAEADCRSVILILEKESRFDIDAIAAWNALADDLKDTYSNHIEQQVSEYRIVVLSEDPDFLSKVAAALSGPAS
jgi:uncharacterized membrane protein